MQVVYLGQEIRLVFNRVFGCSKPRLAVLPDGGGVMPCCRKIKILSDPLFETAELDEFVTHHIRIRRQSFPYFINRVGGHILPVFLMQVHDFQGQTILTGNGSGHFNIFFGRAIHILRPVHTYFDIEKSRFVSLLTKKVNDNRAIDTSGQ